MRYIPMVLVCTVLAACSPAPEKAGNTNAASSSSGQHLEKVPLVITHTNGQPQTRLLIEIALGKEEQEAGLMHRTDLKPGDGMLFPMIPARMPNFWMKDTPTSLDVLFIAMDGRVVHIIPNARPNDRTPLFAEQPVAAVVELMGGDAQRLGISEGDTVAWGECATEAASEPSAEPDNFCPA